MVLSFATRKDNIGATLGATISFLIARYIFKKIIHDHFGPKLQTFNHELQEYGHLYLLGLHFFPITPFFILNLLAGVTHVSLWTFVWTTIVGVSPAFCIYSYFGQGLTSINNVTDIISAKFIVPFFALKGLSIITVLIGRLWPKKG